VVVAHSHSHSERIHFPSGRLGFHACALAAASPLSPPRLPMWVQSSPACSFCDRHDTPREENKLTNNTSGVCKKRNDDPTLQKDVPSGLFAIRTREEGWHFMFWWTASMCIRPTTSLLLLVLLVPRYAFLCPPDLPLFLLFLLTSTEIVLLCFLFCLLSAPPQRGTRVFFPRRSASSTSSFCAEERKEKSET
jgi:hypothetical protein